MRSSEKKSLVKNIRFSNQDIERADMVIESLNEHYGLNLNFSDLVCMLIKSEYNRLKKLESKESLS